MSPSEYAINRRRELARQRQRRSRERRGQAVPKAETEPGRRSVAAECAMAQGGGTAGLEE